MVHAQPHATAPVQYSSTDFDEKSIRTFCTQCNTYVGKCFTLGWNTSCMVVKMRVNQIQATLFCNNSCLQYIVLFTLVLFNTLLLISFVKQPALLNNREIGGLCPSTLCMKLSEFLTCCISELLAAIWGSYLCHAILTLLSLGGGSLILCPKHTVSSTGSHGSCC
jgi:hypothetical protein